MNLQVAQTQYVNCHRMRWMCSALFCTLPTDDTSHSYSHRSHSTVCTLNENRADRRRKKQSRKKSRENASEKNPARSAFCHIHWTIIYWDSWDNLRSLCKMLSWHALSRHSCSESGRERHEWHFGWSWIYAPKADVDGKRVEISKWSESWTQRFVVWLGQMAAMPMHQNYSGRWLEKQKWQECAGKRKTE